MSQDLPHYRTILLERRSRLLVLTFNRPDALNAVNLDLHDELPEALVFAGQNKESDVVLLTGAGSAFPLAVTSPIWSVKPRTRTCSIMRRGRRSGAYSRCSTSKSRPSVA